MVKEGGGHALTITSVFNINRCVPEAVRQIRDKIVSTKRSNSNRKSQYICKPSSHKPHLVWLIDQESTCLCLHEWLWGSGWSGPEVGGGAARTAFTH